MSRAEENSMGAVPIWPRAASTRSSVRYALSRIQQPLRLAQHFPRQYGRRSVLSRSIKSFAPVFSQHLHISLHRDQRHSKCIYHVDLPNRSSIDQLTGKQPKTAHVVGVTLK